MRDEGVDKLKESSLAHQLLVLNSACNVDHLVNNIVDFVDRELVDLYLEELAGVDLFFWQQVDGATVNNGVAMDNNHVFQLLFREGKNILKAP